MKRKKVSFDAANAMEDAYYNSVIFEVWDTDKVTNRI